MMQMINMKPEIRYDAMCDKLRWEMKYAYLSDNRIHDGWVIGESEADCLAKLQSIKEGIRSMEEIACKI